MSNIEYYNKLESLLESQITSIKKMSYLFGDSSELVRKMSGLVSKTRELKQQEIMKVDVTYGK